MLHQPLEELQFLAFLKKLTVSYNELVDLWPVPLQLETLIISHNKLGSISENVAKLVGLKYLDVSFNRLTNVQGVQALVKLQTFNVSNNEVYKLLVDE